MVDPETEEGVTGRSWLFCYMPAGMAFALEQDCTDNVMPGLERMGGVSGSLEAAELAAARRLPMSSHLFPEVSAHLLCATPTCHFLEHVDWANVCCRSRSPSSMAMP